MCASSWLQNACSNGHMPDHVHSACTRWCCCKVCGDVTDAGCTPVLWPCLQCLSATAKTSPDSIHTNSFLLLCRILFEVANLERSTTLRNEECLLLLADATRFAYKTHQFAGGFNVDSAELFGKVKRLTQYYTRSMDPTWLKDNTKFSSSNRQKWDHVARR